MFLSGHHLLANLSGIPLVLEILSDPQEQASFGMFMWSSRVLRAFLVLLGQAWDPWKKTEVATESQPKREGFPTEIPSR